jgi:hypothetical protein
MSIKQEIIMEVFRKIFQEDPYLDPATGDLLKIIEIAYRMGYEAAIQNYYIEDKK